MVAAAAEGQVHGQIDVKVLITGAGGMLGSDLAAKLATTYDVIGIGQRPAPHLNVPYRIANVTDGKVVQAFMEAEKPQIVLHAAAMTDVDGCETDRLGALAGNFEATRNVTEAANRVGALVVFFSTDFVFDGEKTEPYQEEDLPHPLSVYGETKLLAERYLHLRAKRFLILRTSWTFGEHGNHFLKKVLKKAEKGEPLQVVSDQRGNPTYTADLADAVKKILEVALAENKNRNLENQIYHLTNEGPVSRYELTRWILHRKNYPLHLVVPVTSDQVSYPAERPKNSVLSTEKAGKTFGIKMRTWQEAVEAYFEESGL